jgi:hypothetical protein
MGEGEPLFGSKCEKQTQRTQRNPHPLPLHKGTDPTHPSSGSSVNISTRKDMARDRFPSMSSVRQMRRGENLEAQSTNPQANPPLGAHATRAPTPAHPRHASTHIWLLIHILRFIQRAGEGRGSRVQG